MNQISIESSSISSRGIKSKGLMFGVRLAVRNLAQYKLIFRTLNNLNNFLCI